MIWNCERTVKLLHTKIVVDAMARMELALIPVYLTKQLVVHGSGHAHC